LADRFCPIGAIQDAAIDIFGISNWEHTRGREIVGILPDRLLEDSKIPESSYIDETIKNGSGTAGEGKLIIYQAFKLLRLHQPSCEKTADLQNAFSRVSCIPPYNGPIQQWNRERISSRNISHVCEICRVRTERISHCSVCSSAWGEAIFWIFGILLWNRL
jgi:hypothetical protein